MKREPLNESDAAVRKAVTAAASRKKQREVIGVLFICRSCNYEWFDVFGLCPKCRSPLVKQITESIYYG